MLFFRNLPPLFMQNSVHYKIRLLLNELAILNQPESISDAIVYSDDILLKIKQLSAELYINSELAINRFSMPQTAITEPQATIADEMNTQPEIAAVHVEEVAVVEVPEHEVIPELPQNQPAIEQIEEPEVQEVQELAPVVESVAEVVENPVAVAEGVPVIEAKPEVVQPVQTSHSNSVDINSKISLTRRFEYINNLFGGDASAFAEFLKNISLFSSLSQSMDYFEAEFDKRNWKRKEESAMEFKSIIKKSLQ